MFTLPNIIQQCTEWQRHLYLNFVDSEEAFHNVYRQSLWPILRAYANPQQIVFVIKGFYNKFKCRKKYGNGLGLETGVIDKDVLCLLYSSTRRLTGLCGKQHRTLHRASNKPSSQPWRCGFHRWSSVCFTHSSAHGRENHPSEHVCTTSMPEDQSKEDTSMVAETCLHWKIFKFVRIIFDFSFYNFDLFLICFEKVKVSEAKK